MHREDSCFFTPVQGRLVFGVRSLTCAVWKGLRDQRPAPNLQNCASERIHMMQLFALQRTGHWGVFSAQGILLIIFRRLQRVFWVHNFCLWASLKRWLKKEWVLQIILEISTVMSYLGEEQRLILLTVFLKLSGDLKTGKNMSYCLL